MIQADFIVTYPESLPVSREIKHIKNIVSQNQVTIICGETGSGKTTQLPKMLLDMGYAKMGIIGHTQPRKVATVTLAKRIGKELTQPELVGYKVRFNDRTNKSTKIKLMTDGILLQEIQSNKLLKQYSAIIIDEVHERNLNIDFILGHLKTILNKRPDLKVIITSATIDNLKLSKFFYNAPIISVEGKTYPVDIVYQNVENDGDRIISLNDAIYRAIQSCFDIELGNVLVFLPGEREIKDCISFLRKSGLRNCLLLSLFSRQSEQEQSLVFIDDGKLKIIVTTNIAETSLTIPNIRYVIDSGQARIKRYNSRLKIEQLLIDNIAQANSQQRAGRAGRVSHGMCIRLFGQDEFYSRPEFAQPEILHSNLANVILKLISFNLGDPLAFPFLDMPDNKLFNDGFKTLFQLGAIDCNNKITPLGQQISKIPVDANLARMLIAGGRYGIITQVLIIVSFLAVTDPRQYPVEYQQLVRQKHQIWEDKQSDFLAILNLWSWYLDQVQHNSRKKLVEVCYSHFLAYNNLREWYELHNQLTELIHHLGFKVSISNVVYETLHTALLTGLLNNIGKKDLVEKFYLGTNNKKFYLHPNSTVNIAKWIVSTNLTQTTKLYGRTNAYIESKWLVPLTKHLVKYTYGDEHWDKKRGEVVAMRSTILQGLQIEHKKVSYANTNLKRARELFIMQGLVPSELTVIYPFIIHNQKVIKQVYELEDKLRFSLFIADDALFKFYDKVIPCNICDIKTFEVWVKINQDALKLNIEEFTQSFNSGDENMKLYPDSILVTDESIKLKYIFNPEHEADGVTALIKLNQLTHIEVWPFTWLVPGLIREKLAYMIKALPKNIKLQLNPVNDTITNFLKQAMIITDLANEFTTYINTILRLSLDWHYLQVLKLPKHLIFHYQIHDNNQMIDSGDDLSKIKVCIAPKFNQIINNISEKNEINDLKFWQNELSNLLEKVTFKRKNHEITVYRCLDVKDNKVNFTFTDTLVNATNSTKRGIIFLVRSQIHTQIRYLEQKKLANFHQICLFMVDIYIREILLQDCISFILYMSVDISKIPSSEADFMNLVMSCRTNFTQNATEFGRVLFDIAKHYQQVKLAIQGHTLEYTILQQLDDLIYPGFLKYTSFKHLIHFARYLKAILKRLDKYKENPRRDMALDDEIMRLYELWYNHIDKLEVANIVASNQIYAFKFKIEELRVSLFAQELKTPTPVSSKRLLKELETFGVNT